MLELHWIFGYLCSGYLLMRDTILRSLTQRMPDITKLTGCFRLFPEFTCVHVVSHVPYTIRGITVRLFDPAILQARSALMPRAPEYISHHEQYEGSTFVFLKYSLLNRTPILSVQWQKFRIVWLKLLPGNTESSSTASTYSQEEFAQSRARGTFGVFNTSCRKRELSMFFSKKFYYRSMVLSIRNEP